MSATAADLHSWQHGSLRTAKSPDQLWVNPDCGLKTRGWAEVRLALGIWCYPGYCAHPSRLDGERTALSISDLTGCLSNSWQRHSPMACRPASSRVDHCMRKLRSEATTSGTREGHPTHSSLHPVRMNYCRRSQREQVLMEWT